MDSAQEVVLKDLNFICSELEEDFTVMEGKNLLIVGGAGFLGYYLVQSILHWNDNTQGLPITLTVFDNYMRGIPAWLSPFLIIICVEFQRGCLS
jgi:dTDP-glucose 4,6-dehydratase/UDP-glucuronate decarboxylase